MQIAVLRRRIVKNFDILKDTDEPARPHKALRRTMIIKYRGAASDVLNP
jgi:hypothetical protein